MPRPLPEPLRRRSFDVADARRLGVAAHRLRANDLVAPFRGIRMPAERACSLVELARAYACRMPADHVFAGPTAAAIWGLPLPLRFTRDDRLHVLALDGGRAPRSSRVVGHTTARPVTVWIVEDVRVVDPVAAWIGLAGVIPIDDLVAAGDRLIGLPVPLAEAAAIDAAIVAHARRRGARDLRTARTLMRPNVYSARETKTRLLIVRAGHPEPEPNGVIRLPSGRSIRGDLVFREHRVLVEYEGDHHRTDPEQWARDLDRYNELTAAGWLVVRISARMSDVQVVAAITRALEARAA